jgi:hypothetical protein
MEECPGIGDLVMLLPTGSFRPVGIVVDMTQSMESDIGVPMVHLFYDTGECVWTPIRALKIIGKCNVP